MESFDTFPQLYLLVYVIEVLDVVFKGRNLGFWKSTLTQAHRVGCSLQARGTVGMMSISGAHGSCRRMFNPRLLFLFIFFFSRLNKRGLGSVRGEESTTYFEYCSNNGKSYRNKTTEQNAYRSILSKKPGPIVLTENAESVALIWSLPTHRLHAWKYTPNFLEGCSVRVRENLLCALWQQFVENR